MANARIDQHRVRLDTELPQDRHQQQGLVLAITEPAAEHRVGARRSKCSAPDRDADVADLVLDELQGMKRLLLGRAARLANVLGYGTQFRARAFTDLEQGCRPGSHLSPVPG